MGVYLESICVHTNVAHNFLAIVDGAAAHGRSITGCLWLGPGLSWQQQQPGPGNDFSCCVFVPSVSQL